MRIAVVGTGYVGLVSGVCLSAKGHHVTCVDKNPKIVEQLSRGEPHIYEVGLPELLTEVIEAGRFAVTSNLDEALPEAELVMIAVGTPSDGSDIDLTYIKGAAREIGEHIKTRGEDRPLSVIVKSTVVPGTTDTVVKAEIEAASGMSHPAFGLGMAPEFLREGEAIEDFMYPDRIVMGAEDPLTAERLDTLFAPWECDKIRVNTRTAELIKYANNAMLATQISAMNEIANIASIVGGIDVRNVVAGVSSDKRWSPILEDGRRVSPGIVTYLVPGCGFGGSCFPKDVQALAAFGAKHGAPTRILDGVLAVNGAQPHMVVQGLKNALGDLSGAKALVLGLAFKPGTDDVRETPAAPVIEDLLAAGAEVAAHDPIAVESFQRMFGETASRTRIVEDWKAEVPAAEIVVLITRWPEYEALAEADMTGKTLFDARRLLSADKVPGARYLSIGLG